MKCIQILIATLSLFVLVSCQKDNDNGNSNLVDINEIDPNGNGNGNGNAENLGSMVELGRMLFWDPVLSGEKDVACATCHHPNFGYADGRDLSIGVGGAGLGPNRIDVTPDDIGIVRRNAPTVINTAFNGINNNGDFNPASAPMFWDNRAFSLENQALLPLQSFEEMRGHAFDEALTLDSLVARLQAIAAYDNLFTNAFGNNNSINSQNIGRAIAEFERTITATDSPFDRFQAGDPNALSQAALRGMDVFEEVGCNDCHSGPMFSDFELHTLGVPDHPQLDETDSGANEAYEFRTPTLRNLSQTGPFFHNGMGQNLQQTIQFYITARNFARNNGGGPGGNGNAPGGGLDVNPNVDSNDIDNEVRDLGNFNNNDIQDIIAFINALNDPNFDRTIPTSVPSGLNPGGNIN